MQPLKEAVLRLRRELAEAFDVAGTAGNNCQVKAGQAALDLTVALGTGGWQVLEASDSSINPAQTHRLRLELTLESLVHSPAPSVTRPDHRQEAPASLLGQLSEVFGAPGFDSSARATVFRECVESLSPDEIRATIAASGAAAAKGIPEAIRMAAHQIGRLLERGPAGPARGREILARVFEDTDSSTVLSTVLGEWKTQDDWIDRSDET